VGLAPGCNPGAFGIGGSIPYTLTDDLGIHGSSIADLPCCRNSPPTVRLERAVGAYVSAEPLESSPRCKRDAFGLSRFESDPIHLILDGELDVLKYHGKVTIPEAVIRHSNTIKFENYKTNTPTKFQIRSLVGGEELMESLAKLIGLPKSCLDFVYFSVCKGAEPHTDKLNPKKFEDITYVIPTILPKGKSVITAVNEAIEVEVGGVYQFNHTEIHSMKLEDMESGCVVVMVAIKK
jgi:hypothetical protein